MPPLDFGLGILSLKHNVIPGRFLLFSLHFRSQKGGPEEWVDKEK